MEEHGVHQVFSYQSISSKYIFVFSRRKKLIQLWNNLRVTFIFGWTMLLICQQKSWAIKWRKKKLQFKLQSEN